jgi:hypothetical protein
MRQGSRILILAGFAALVLHASAHAQGRRVFGPASNPPAAAAPAGAREGADEGVPALDDLTATRERPLFSSTRRPPEVEPPPQVAAPIVEAASMPFELVGIVQGSDVSAAIFRNTDTKEETRVPKGEKIGDWSVDEISDRAVLLHGKDKRVRMRLFNEANTPGVQVGRIGDDGKTIEPESPAPAADDNDEEVDEDITPSNSPAVRPATAQPKPPPTARNPRNARQHPPRPGRGEPRRPPRPPRLQPPPQPPDDDDE